LKSQRDGEQHVFVCTCVKLEVLQPVGIQQTVTDI